MDNIQQTIPPRLRSGIRDNNATVPRSNGYKTGCRFEAGDIIMNRYKVISDLGQGAASDQYALAVMTYEMLAGHLPFENPDAAVLKQAVLDEEPEPIPSIDKKVQEAIKRAMSKDPADRFLSCLDFVSALSGKKIKNDKKIKINPMEWGALVILLFIICGWYFLQQKEL